MQATFELKEQEARELEAHQIKLRCLICLKETAKKTFRVMLKIDYLNLKALKKRFSCFI